MTFTLGYVYHIGIHVTTLGSVIVHQVARVHIHTSAFGSNTDDMFVAIATLYCREIEKHRIPSNVVSRDVDFLTT
jgi:hypothetical protein